MIPTINRDHVTAPRVAPNASRIEFLIGTGRQLAELIAHAQFFESPGSDHVPWTGDDVDAITEKIEEFLTGSKPAASIDRVLATVLFTDIVASTEKAESLGDRRWKVLLSAHDDIVRRELIRFRGNEVKSLGDGFLATFDGPARAAHCALSIIEAIRLPGIEISAGIHTGEVELQESDVRGIAVHVAARIVGQASGVTRPPTATIATYRTSVGLGWSTVLHCATVAANRGSLSEESRLSKREAKKWLKTVAIWSS